MCIVGLHCKKYAKCRYIFVWIKCTQMDVMVAVCGFREKEIFRRFLRIEKICVQLTKEVFLDRFTALC